MSEATSHDRADLSALDGGGDISRPNASGYVTLDVDSHYFILGGVKGSPLSSVQIVTDGTIAGVFTVETCNLPRDQVSAPYAITDYDETSGNWIKEDPSTAYVPTVGTGWSVANLTLTKTAGVGGAMIHIGNLGCRRVRIKAAITTGGTVRVSGHAKTL